MDAKNLMNLTIHNVSAIDLIELDAMLTKHQINIYEKIDDMTAIMTAIRTQNEQLFREVTNEILTICFPSECTKIATKHHTASGSCIYTIPARYLYLVGNDAGKFWAIISCSPDTYQTKLQTVLRS